MLTATRLFFAFFGLSLLMCGSIFVYGSSSAAGIINLPKSSLDLVPEGDEPPEITDRVARISFLAGEARVRRSNSDQWEKAALNLPIVEGDELVTDADGRVELQFDKAQHLRLAENSYLKIVNLKDNGIAVSLSLGKLTLRITSFDLETSFFEIDAPKTTFAIQQAGSYRVDAGKRGDSEVRFTATDGGEARVYSDNSGFTLNSGRSTSLSIAGPNAGEWDTSSATRFDDDFGSWSANRDLEIARNLKSADYDRFYDDDIYGADDLKGNGDWIHTVDFGYVWRPSRQAVSRYTDWSPYRYGHWRWVPPYGWTWVNDEPWGWATYHHGRWFYHNGYWNWSPYGHYRGTRSWWSPALVVISVFNTRICWYPLPYYQRRNNNNWGRNRHPRQPNPVVVPPSPIATGGTRTPKVSMDRMPPDRVPPTGVVGIDEKDFGKKTGGILPAPTEIAKTILARPPEGVKNVRLPDPTEKGRRTPSEIVVAEPNIPRTGDETKTGAAPRKLDRPMDAELRKSRTFGGRTPQTLDNIPAVVKSTDNESDIPRRTGAIERKPLDRPNDSTIPRYNPPTPKESPRFEPPSDSEKPRRTPSKIDLPVDRESPRYTPPVSRERVRMPKESPRQTPPVTTESPRSDPPKTREIPRGNPPPTRQPPRNEAPPTKSEPKPDRPVDRPVNRKADPIDG